MPSQTKMSFKIGVGQKGKGNGQDKDKSAYKGGQKIYYMPLVRAKGTIFAQEGARLF
jgi:hypothetical protein